MIFTGRRRLIALLAVLLLVGLLVGWRLAAGGSDPSTDSAAPRPTAPAPTPSPVIEPAAPPPTTIATSHVPELDAYDAPADAAGVVATLTDTTDYGAPRTFLVVDEQDQWFEVLLPIRPNGTTGWIHASDVTTATTTYSIRIDLGAHKVMLYDAGEPILDSGTVVGSAETPTPPGMFYVTDPVDLREDPDGPYGVFALGLSGYSDVLYEFAGGPGQLALHGTNRPDQLGQDISNGCVRVPNEVILQFAERVPLGTPVEIVA